MIDRRVDPAQARAALPTRARLAGWLERPVDGSSLALLRILFGLILIGGTVRFLLEGWVEVLFVEPRVFLKYWGFSWVRVWPRWGMYAHYVALGLLAAAITVGYRTRVAAALFCLGFTYVELMDVTNYLNHYYLVSLLAVLMVVTPVGRMWSLDARHGREPATETVPAWCLYLLRFQIAVVYVNAGLAKLGSDWLLHAQPLGIWLAARNETPIIGPWLTAGWIAHAMSWAGFVFDSTIVLFLAWRRTRPLAYLCVLVFHFMTHVFFDIGLFPFLMTACATIFFEPDWPRRVVARLALFGNGRLFPEPGLSFAAGASPIKSEADGPQAVRRSRSGVRARRLQRRAYAGSRFAAATALMVFCTLQVLVPLRHYVYDGPVLWHEQGMRWAWRVMVREKNGSITYHARDPATGRRWQVTPTRYLTWRQANEMAGQPDLVLQVAHLVAAELRAKGVARPEVRVEAWVSLNGRRPALMIDPGVDLAAIADGLAPAAWILPAPQEPPLTAGARVSVERAG